MDSPGRPSQAGLSHPGSPGAPDPLSPAVDPARVEAPEQPVPEYDETLIEEIGALFSDARTYAEAEFGFQKSRARLAGRNIGMASALLVVALVLFHIALLALAVGLVIALAPVITIWGAIAVVVGVLLALTAWLALAARKRIAKFSALFSSKDKVEDV